jgi:hypothetical protein
MNIVQHGPVAVIEPLFLPIFGKKAHYPGREIAGMALRLRAPKHSWPRLYRETCAAPHEARAISFPSVVASTYSSRPPNSWDPLIKSQLPPIPGRHIFDRIGRMCSCAKAERRSGAFRDRPTHFRKLAHVGCRKIFPDLPVHTSCTRRPLTRTSFCENCRALNLVALSGKWPGNVAM